MLVKSLRRFIYSPACASTLNKLLALVASTCFLIIFLSLFWLADGYLVFEGWGTAEWLFLCTVMFFTGCISSLILAVFLEYRIVEHIVKILGVDIKSVMSGDRIQAQVNADRAEDYKQRLNNVVTILSHSHTRVEDHNSCPVCAQLIPDANVEAAAGYYVSLWKIAANSRV